LEPQLILTRGTTAIAAAVAGDVEAIHIMAPPSAESSKGSR